MNRRTVINSLLLSLLAALILGCSAQLEATGLPSLVGAPAFGVTGWPNVSLGLITPVESQPAVDRVSNSPAELYVLDRVSPKFAAQFVPPADMSRYVAVPRQKLRPLELSVPQFQIPLGQPVQVAAVISSRSLLTALDLRVNGQPIGADAASFPAELLRVQLCAPVWQRPAVTGLIQLCPPESITTTNSLDLRAASSRQANLALVLTGGVPGIYRLTLTATDGAGQTNQTNYLITVAD